jgi:hypothetical protein
MNRVIKKSARPNWSFNADANTGHAFGILLASVGALRPYGLRRRLTLALGLYVAFCLARYQLRWTAYLLAIV